MTEDGKGKTRTDTDFKPETSAVQPNDVEEFFGSVSYPVFKSTPFAFESVAQMEDTFRGKGERFIYGRYGNPTVDAAERKFASFEGAESALIFSSGMAAISSTVVSLLSGDRKRILASSALYGGTLTFMRDLQSRFGVELVLVDSSVPGEMEAAVDGRTALVLVETPSNPTLRITDIRAAAEIAHNKGAYFVVDNTFATPVNQRPLEHGADVVVHSATKFLGGHSDLLLGIAAGSTELISGCLEQRKNLGGAADPEQAWLLMRSMQSLYLRVERHNASALEIARRLGGNAGVTKVYHPGLEGHPGHDTAARQMTGFGGVVSFDVGERVEEFIGSLRLIRLVPSLGGVETTVLVPAVSSHIRLSEEQRNTLGITAGLVRMSVGIENVDDIWEDVKKGLKG